MMRTYFSVAMVISTCAGLTACGEDKLTESQAKEAFASYTKTRSVGPSTDACVQEQKIKDNDLHIITKLSFNNCQHGSYTVSGDVHQQILTTPPHSSGASKTRIVEQGTVRVEGPAKAECEVDVERNSEVTSNAPTSVHQTGTFCGYNVVDWK